jgi:hypothetical protein
MFVCTNFLRVAPLFGGYILLYMFEEEVEGTAR